MTLLSLSANYIMLLKLSLGQHSKCDYTSDSLSSGGLLVNLLYLFHFPSIQYMNQATQPKQLTRPWPHSLNHPSNWLDPWPHSLNHPSNWLDPWPHSLNHPSNWLRPRSHSLNHPSNWLDPGHTPKQPWPHSLNHPSNWLDPGHTAWKPEPSKQLTRPWPHTQATPGHSLNHPSNCLNHPSNSGHTAWTTQATDLMKPWPLPRI